MRKAGFMLQNYKLFWKMMVYSQIIRNFAAEYGNQAAEDRLDARESGESPELYLQL